MRLRRLPCRRSSDARVLIRLWFPYLEGYSHGVLVSPLSRALKKKIDPISLIFFPEPPWTSPRYMWNYLHRSALVLAHYPSAEAVTTEDFVLKSNIGCGSCLQYMREYLLEISVALGEEIKKAVERVGSSSRSPYLRCSKMHT